MFFQVRVCLRNRYCFIFQRFKYKCEWKNLCNICECFDKARQCEICMPVVDVFMFMMLIVYYLFFHWNKVTTENTKGFICLAYKSFFVFLLAKKWIFLILAIGHTIYHSYDNENCKINKKLLKSNCRFWARSQTWQLFSGNPISVW